jgi:hypothetical protein
VALSHASPLSHVLPCFPILIQSSIQEYEKNYCFFFTVYYTLYNILYIIFKYNVLHHIQIQVQCIIQIQV